MNIAEFRAIERIGSHHYGPATFIPLGGDNEVWETGEESIDTFDPPADFSWDEWFDLAEEVGCTSVFLTSKHVGGVTMWASDITNGPESRSLKETAWYQNNGERDLLQEFCDMARERNLSVGLYFCLLDRWAYLQFDEDWSDSNLLSYQQQQLTELFTDYGDFDYVMLDGWGSFWAGNGPTFIDIPVEDIKDHIQSIQPNCLCLINNHESSQRGETVGDVALYEGIVDGEPGANLDEYEFTRCFWRPVRRGGGTAYTEWFTHEDSVVEEWEPSVRFGSHMLARMKERQWPVVLNFCYGPTGTIEESERQILTRMCEASLPAIHRNLTSYYRLDEATVAADARDYVNLNHMTRSNNPGIANGIKGRARTFNGSNQKFRTVNARDFDMVTNGGSFSVLFKTPSSYSTEAVLIAKDLGGGEGGEYSLSQEADGSVTWKASPDGLAVNVVELNNGAPLSTNSWHQVVAIFDNDIDLLKMYVDGGAPVSVAFPGENISGGGIFSIPFTIGARGDAADVFQPYTGTIDGVGYWQDYSLTDADVAYLYNDGAFRAPPFYPVAAVDLANDLSLRYPMNTSTDVQEELLNVLTDITMNGYRGQKEDSELWEYVSTERGKALSFNDDSLWARALEGSALLGATPISVFMWVKPLGAASDLAVYASKALNESPWNGWFLRENTGLSATVTVGGTDYTAKGPGAISLPVGEWSHIGFTYDGESLIVYLDGVAGTPNTAMSGPIEPPVTAMFVGNDSAFQDRGCNSLLQDLRIYNRILSAAEISLLLAFGSGRRNNVSMILGI